jgi:hypothetical protein
MDKKRSVGIIIFSIVFILLGLLFLLAMPLFSILYIITGIGILTLKPFARYLAIATSILGVVINTIKLVGYWNKGISSQIIIALVGTYLIHLGVIYFFNRPKVKEQFK